MRSIIINKKKGDIFQVLFAIALLLGVSIAGLLLLKMTTEVNNFWDDSGLLNETEIGKQSIDTIQDIAPSTTDYAILFLFLGLNIGIVVAAVRTNFSVVVIFLFILLTLIAIIFAAASVNMYQGLAQQEEIVEVSTQLTFINFIFSRWFPLIISIICGLVMLIMYGKSGADMVG